MNMLVLATAGFKLVDLLNSAGAPIGVIIAGTIFLQFLSTKFSDLLGRYRQLTGEYRGGNDGDVRHGALQSQIQTYRRRLRLMLCASWLAAIALCCFLGSILAGGISIVFPGRPTIDKLGTAWLFLGLVLIGVGVLVELFESVLAVGEIMDEVRDLDGPVN